MRAELPSETKPSLGIIGHLAIDEIVHPILGVRSLPGGSAAAVATASVQTGVVTSIYSKVGKDFSSEWLSVLENLGIDISKVEISDKDESLKVKIIYDEKGNKELIECSDAVSSNLAIKILPRAEGIHICPIKPQEQMELVQRLKGHSDILSLNLSEYFIDDYKKEDFFAKLNWQYLDLVFANEKEAGTLTGLDKPEDMASIFHSEGVDLAVITLGSKGSLVYDGRNMHYMNANEVTVVDTTGCGDSYIGGFLGDYLISKDAKKAAGMGTYFASLTAQKKGSWAALVSDVGYRF
ncbi:MAG: carbohydrate kinase family protein [Thermoplasmata archaeon]|nr:MAG: carbohydrate kinase family protein [Thermoplasmata archaeon]